MKVVAVVQARMGSARLPGKVLLPLDGIPVIQWIWERLNRCRQLQDIVVATGDSPADDRLADTLRRLGAQVFRGSEHDVLDRYYRAARAVRADAIVRVTGDCPLIDPELVDQVASGLRAGQPELHYVSNIHPPTYPDGLDAEAFTLEALYKTWHEAEWASEREHVTLYMRKHPERFPQEHVRCNRDLSHHRWTLDEEADYRFLDMLVRLAAEAGLNPREASWRQWLNLTEQYPQLARMNGGIPRNEGARKSLQEDCHIRLPTRSERGLPV